MKYLTCSFLTYCFLTVLAAQVTSANRGSVQIRYTAGHPDFTFIPEQVLGAAFDGHAQGDINRILIPENIAVMKTVGLNPVSYRLRTELGIEAWHWNPKGQWSEPGKQEGYWISDNFSDQPIQLSNGYRLPRRGNTHDQANDDGYSRLDDGDTNTFWKSNPYLGEYYTKDPDSLHPQWVIVDLGKLKLVNAIRIKWADPFALSFKVDYALDNGHVYFDPLVPNTWHNFSHGDITDQEGGDNIITVSSKPVMVRYIRISMTKSSQTTDATGHDIRDKLGFAIAELYAGLVKKDNKFYDWVHHAADNESQSITYASSTDPWHSAADIDPNTEEAGIDLFFQSGITGKQPAMIPVGLLYDNPDNMKALIQYLLTKNYPVTEIEMGEEPDGQL
ncbi:MAG TPA: discoidin domain-containing protein, partial [Chitinophagaceae bacterium]